MEMNTAMETALNEQMTREFQSSYIYTAMAGWLHAEGFPGAGAWMEAQAAEEHDHAMRFFRFVLDRGGRARPGALTAPATAFVSLLDVFEKALEHERFISGAIKELYALAMEESDYASLPLLDWFVNEQIEEEATVAQIVEDLRRAGGQPQALLLLDRELGARGSAPAA